MLKINAIGISLFHILCVFISHIVCVSFTYCVCLFHILGVFISHFGICLIYFTYCACFQESIPPSPSASHSSLQEDFDGVSSPSWPGTPQQPSGSQGADPNVSQMHLFPVGEIFIYIDILYAPFGTQEKPQKGKIVYPFSLDTDFRLELLVWNHIADLRN